MRKLTLTLCAAALMSVHTHADAALIAEYNFNDGTADDSAGSFDLNAIGGGGTIAGGVLSLDGNNSSYYENTANGLGALNFTVSVWVKASVTNQGGFKGLFTNADNSTDAFSWQIDNNSGQFRAVAIDTAANITGPTSGDGAPVANRWQNVVIKKNGDVAASELWVDGTLVGTNTGNLGGLQEFRVGINRNSDNQYGGLYDKVQVYDSNESVADTFALGHLNQTNSWIAGLGGDSGGDSTWQPVVGSTNIAFDSNESLSPTGIASVPNAYSSPIGDGGGASSSAVFGGSDDASFETLIRLDNLTGNHIVWEIGGNGSGSNLALVGSELRFSTQSGSTANLMTASTTLDAGDLGEWLHVVTVITEPGDGTGTAELFVNSISVDSDTIGAAYNGWAGGDAFAVGHVQSTVAGTLSGLSNFDGEMALWSHYDFALSRQDVIDQAQHFGIPAPAALPAGLLMIVGLAARRRRIA